MKRRDYGANPSGQAISKTQERFLREGGSLQALYSGGQRCDSNTCELPQSAVPSFMHSAVQCRTIPEDRYVITGTLWWTWSLALGISQMCWNSVKRWDFAHLFQLLPVVVLWASRKRYKALLWLGSVKISNMVAKHQRFVRISDFQVEASQSCWIVGLTLARQHMKNQWAKIWRSQS